MYKQVIAIYMHACRLTTITSLGNLQSSHASHTLSEKGVACETYTYYLHISMYNSVITTERRVSS